MTIPSRTVNCACDTLNDMGENAKGMNRINRRIYIDAQTSPMLSGLLVRVSKHVQWGREASTHIGVLYTFNRSRPFRLALTNVGPSAGMR